MNLSSYRFRVESWSSSSVLPAPWLVFLALCVVTQTCPSSASLSTWRSPVHHPQPCPWAEGWPAPCPKSRLRWSQTTTQTWTATGTGTWTVRPHYEGQGCSTLSTALCLNWILNVARADPGRKHVIDWDLVHPDTWTNSQQASLQLRIQSFESICFKTCIVVQNIKLNSLMYICIMLKTLKRENIYLFKVIYLLWNI